MLRQATAVSYITTRSPVSMRMRRRGERRRVHQNSDTGRAGQSGEVRFTIVIEVGCDQSRRTVANTEGRRRLKRSVAVAEQNSHMARVWVGVVGDR